MSIVLGIIALPAMIGILTLVGWSCMHIMDRPREAVGGLVASILLVLAGVMLMDFLSGPDEPFATSTPSPRATLPTPKPKTPAEPTNFTALVIAGAVVLVLVAGALLVFWWRAHLGPRAQQAKERTLAARRAADEAQAHWSAASTEEAAAVHRWLAYEKDLKLAMDFPLMRQMGSPLIRDVVAAMTRASSLSKVGPDVVPGRSAADQPYVVAVRDFTTVLSVAETEARRVKRSIFTAEQRRSLSTADRMFALATDEGVSSAERRVALDRLTRLLDGLIDVPYAVVEQIGHTARPHIEAR